MEIFKKIIATATFALLRLLLYFSIKINEFNSFRYICVCLGLVDLFPTEIGLEGAYRNRIGRSFSIKECGLVIIILILLVKINTTNSPKQAEFTLFSRDIPVNFLIDRQEEISHLINKIETEMHNESGADQCYNDFTNLIRQEMYRKVQYKNIKLKEGVNNKKRRVKKPWWSEELTVLWNELCLKERAMLKAEANSKRIKREEFLRQRKLFNKEVQRAKRKYWKAKQIEIENLETSDQKAFWKQIGKIGIGQERKKDIPNEVKLENGEISNNIEDVLRVWKTNFENLLNRNHNDSTNIPDTPIEQSNYDYFDNEISIEEIKAAIRNLKSNKAIGIDELPAEVLRCDNLLSTLHTLFNKCFVNGIIPTAWKQGIINPIPKSSTSDRRDPLSYRGITLTSSVYKLYCIILNARLSKWEAEHCILGDNQNGFRKSSSTIDHLASLTSIIETRKLRKKDTFTAFIDFTKAYDSIDRGILFTKVLNFGISGLMYKALLALYDGVRCSVRINGKLTEWFNVNCGLKQGCSLSSILFNLYINDLIAKINSLDRGIDIDGEKIGILVYADDVVLIAENEEELQQMMNELNLWCENNKLEVNINKSKVIHFRNPSKQRTNRVFQCGQKPIETISQYLYLGLLLTEHLEYDIMAKQVANSASRALGLLITKFKAAGGLPFSTYKKLYDSTVLSIINYGASIWGCKRFSSISAVQNRALRFFLGVGRYTPNAAVNGDMGWDSVYQQQWRNVMNQWCRIQLMDHNRLNYKIYQWSVSQGNHQRKNWAYRIKSMMSESNIGDLFLTSSVNMN